MIAIKPSNFRLHLRPVSLHFPLLPSALLSSPLRVFSGTPRRQTCTKLAGLRPAWRIKSRSANLRLYFRTETAKKSTLDLARPRGLQGAPGRSCELLQSSGNTGRAPRTSCQCCGTISGHGEVALYISEPSDVHQCHQPPPEPDPENHQK